MRPSSPSLGKIRKVFDLKKLALKLEGAGVVGLSILTEPDYFNGLYHNLDLNKKN
ncbi:MAG: hypothetical protein GF329_15085 [Candidatus Lokiarchaeota archaeon]|nr:hypothetical protein [Candidatus Lokiarchaeota archaeon]